MGVGGPRGESHGMKQLLQILGVIALAQGVMGLLNEFTD